jgi:hypothetical protein
LVKGTSGVRGRKNCCRYLTGRSREEFRYDERRRRRRKVRRSVRGRRRAESRAEFGDLIVKERKKRRGDVQGGDRGR